MNYEVRHELRFRLNGSSDQELHLAPGDVVVGVEIKDCPRDADWMRRAAQNEQAKAAKAGDGTVRAVFFKARGVVRYAQAGTDLSATRRPATVPTED